MKTVAKPSKIRSIAPGVLAALIGLSSTVAQAAETASPSHLRLVDRLDRPQDGYCVDILGTPGFLRPDLPLFAHNCKRGLTSDSAVVFTEKGQIQFPAVNLCITVAGVNSGALPGASLLLRGCGEATPFFETDRLQRFSLDEDSRLKLNGTDLCLTVGTRSATTYSSADVWRALFVDECKKVDASRVKWEFVVP